MHDTDVTKKTAATTRCAEACAFFNVRRLSRLLERHYSRALKPSGVTASQFAILVGVSASHEPSVTALGRTIGMSQSALSRQLGWMVRRGWIEVASGSGRAQRVRLGRLGEMTVRKALPRWQQAQDVVVESLGIQPWERLLAGIRELSATTRVAPPSPHAGRPRSSRPRRV